MIFFQTTQSLPDLPTNTLVLLGLILVLGALFGDAAERLSIPWITGCILVGVALGPAGIGIVQGSRLEVFAGFINASLALIAFNIGGQLTITRLRSVGYGVALVALGQLLMPFFLVLIAETMAGLSLPAALIVAAIAPATAPTTTYAIIKRSGSRGSFVDRVFGVLAINDAISILVFSAASSAAIALSGTHAHAPAIGPSLLSAAINEGASILVGIGIGLFYLAIIRIIEDGTPEWQSRLTSALLGLVVISIGSATALGLSNLMIPLSFGAIFANSVREVEGERLHNSLKVLEGPLFIIFFVLAGAHLPLSAADHIYVFGLSLVYLAARFAGKYLGVFISAAVLGYDKATRNYLGLCFPAQGGLAMGLILSFRSGLTVMNLQLEAMRLMELAVSIILVSVLLSQLAGPLLIDYAVRQGTRSVR